MNVELRLAGLIAVNGHSIPIRETFALLDGIARERSVRGAANRLELSYRSAWGRVVSLEAAIGRPVAVKTKGHGTVLLEFGEELRRILESCVEKFAGPLAKEQRNLERRLGALVGAKLAKLRIAASHDPVLIEALAARSDVELSVIGRAAALDRLSTGTVDVAGCHFGSSDRATKDSSSLLRNPAYVAIPAFVREQGLILAPGNPRGIRSVPDLVRTKARFINRQRGSGTRAWFDRMLSKAAIPPNQIVGYGREEFTHQAVGAVIAAGAADAGLGVRAVAEAFGLAFVPLGREAYYLVTHAGERSSLLDSIVADLRERSRAAAGYSQARASQRNTRRR